MTWPGKQTASVLTVLVLLSGALVSLRAQEPPSGEAPSAEAAQDAPRTPVRLSYMTGEVSFWRPGAEDWVAAQINTPIAPGDALYASDGASVELQIGPRTFVRAGADTQVELENQEPDFLQIRVASGHASVDARSIEGGQTIELDTPSAAFMIEASGYYRVDIADDATTFITRRGGHAVMTPADGQASGIAPSEEVVLQGSDNPSVETYAAPDLDDWDRWNYERTDHLIDAVSARYVAPGVYGIDALDHYGSWRVTADYGSVWVPEGVAPDWAPYSAGRWMWDPYYGWTWVDDAPWGWAPCHYGRWVNVSGYWAWAPGPLVAAPVYAPALVAFFGGPQFGVSVGLGAPAVGWVALGWGEPLVPWWGGAGVVGVPTWHGWGGPRVVNNVVINNTTVVNVNNINIYQNVTVKSAVVAMREDRFGRGVAEHVRVREIDPHQLEPLHGRIPVQPVAASLVPRQERARRPPDPILRRPVVATRPPHDTAAQLRTQGLNAAQSPAPAPRIVPAAPHAALTAPRPAFGQRGTEERGRPAEPPVFGAPRAAQPRRPERVAPAEGVREGQPPAPGTNVPPLPAPAGGERGVPPAREAAPQREAVPQVVQPEVMPRRPMPERAAPAVRQPHEVAPEPIPREMPRVAAPRPEPPTRNLPGAPANRVYRPNPETRAPGPNAPAPPRHNAPPAREPAPRRKPHEQ